MTTEDRSAADQALPAGEIGETSHTIPAPPPSRDEDCSAGEPDGACMAPALSEVETLRDGGTIWFRVSAHPLAGSYHLQTPVLGGLRTLFRDGAPLGFGSDAERGVLRALRAWLEAHLGASIAAALPELDDVRAVIRCLQERQSLRQ